MMLRRRDIFELADQAGITAWTKLEWSKGALVEADDGLDGDAACLLQFAGLIMEACAQICEDGDQFGRWTSQDCANAIRERMISVSC